MRQECELSIVIVSYNTRQMTEECLASVYEGLVGLDAQVIVVDNNSTDGTVEMVRERFPKADLIENKENRGFAAANNQGFAIATGAHVLLLNSDTVVLGCVLQSSVAYLKDHSEVGAMGCRVLNSDRTLQRTCSGYPTVGRLLVTSFGFDRLFSFLDTYHLYRWLRNDERDVDVITGCYLMVRREVLAQVGGLDERFFFFGEETDWCLQIRRAGWVTRFAAVGEIIHYGGGSVKKLNHRRDVMLTDAIVRLHGKNAGRMAAIAAFLVLLLFNVSRAMYWKSRGLVHKPAQERAKHFSEVVVSSLASWPRG